MCRRLTPLCFLKANLSLPSQWQVEVERKLIVCLKDRSSSRNVTETLSRHEQIALGESFVFAVKRKIKTPGDTEAGIDGCLEQKASGSSFLSTRKTGSSPGEKWLYQVYTCGEERGNEKINGGKSLKSRLVLTAITSLTSWGMVVLPDTCVGRGGWWLRQHCSPCAHTGGFRGLVPVLRGFSDPYSSCMQQLHTTAQTKLPTRFTSNFCS